MRKLCPISIVFCLALAGCQSGTVPDPNDPAEVGGLTADNMLMQAKDISDGLLSRQDVSQPMYHVLMQQAAEKLVQGANLGKIGAAGAWKYADVLITAKHWQDAATALEVAVEAAKVTHNDDRRVNDSLRLARVLAELDEIPESIKTARSVFDVPPGGAAPILYATYSEIAPAARGKGHDLELAQLVEDSIAIDERVVVDPNTTPGEQFLRWRPVHVRDAWHLVSELYTSANRPDLAAKALQKAEAMKHDFSQELRQRV